MRIKVKKLEPESFDIEDWALKALKQPSNLEEIMKPLENELLEIALDDPRKALVEELKKDTPIAYQNWLTQEESLKNRAEARLNELKQLKKDLISAATTRAAIQFVANRIGVDQATVPPYQSPKLPDFLNNIPD